MHALELADFVLFLSTLSLRRATLNLPSSPIDKNISIHALLAESDKRRHKNTSFHKLFLSTLSLRRATSARPETRRRDAISIHALLAESDR